MDTLIYYMYVIVDFRILIKKFQSRKVKKNSKQKIINKISKKKTWENPKKSNLLFVLTIFVERDGERRSNRNLFLISLVLVVLAEETSTTWSSNVKMKKGLKTLQQMKKKS